MNKNQFYIIFFLIAIQSFGIGQMMNMNGFFQSNLGQIKYPDDIPAPEVKYLCQLGGLKIFFLDNGLAYQMEKYTDSLPAPMAIGVGSFFDTSKIKLETYRMDMELVGANPNPKIIAEGRSRDYTNYYNQDVLDVHSYEKIIYKDIYLNIDWVIYTVNNPASSADRLQFIENNKKESSSTLPHSVSSLNTSSESYSKFNSQNSTFIKYDFIIHPGGDPSQIKLKYKNAEQIYIDRQGNLILRNRLGDIRENAPIAFQNQENIQAKYILKDSTLAFQIKNYNQDHTLTIDPQIEWSTYYGSACTSANLAMQDDTYLYFTGRTGSNTNIAYQGFQNTKSTNYASFLVKMDKDQNRIWATYYGYTSALLNSNMNIGLSEDTDKNIYMCGSSGHSSSAPNLAYNGFKNHLSGPTDGYLVKFDSAGNRIWATYYGGSIEEVLQVCRTDSDNNIIAAGRTRSSDSIHYKGLDSTFAGGNSGDVFVVKFDSAGNRLWATYIGGEHADFVMDIEIDNMDNIYIAGYTLSDTLFDFTTTYPNTPNITDGYIVKLSPHGQYINSYFVSSTSNTWISDIALQNDFIYITGSKTNGSGINNNFITKLDTQYNTIWTSTYPARMSFPASNIVIDRRNNIYHTCHTNGDIGNLYRGFDTSYNGGYCDGVIYKFTPDGDLIWNSYFGGNAIERPTACWIDNYLNLYVLGYTYSSTGIADSSSYQSNLSASVSTFLAKITCNQDTSLYDTICAGDTLVFNAQYLTITGTYYDSLETWDYCDSFITLDLFVKRRDTTHLYDTICTGSIKNFNNQNLSTSGIYWDTLVNDVGCDSFIVLYLEVYPTDTVHIYDTLCDNLPKSFNGQNLSTTGIYRDTLQNQYGCDSHIFYHFIPKPIYETPVSQVICANDSFLFGGVYRKQADVYYDTLKTIMNCDSVIKLTLTVHMLDTTNISKSICRGNTYSFYGQNLSQPGVYTKTFQNKNNCDSTILLTLMVRDTTSYSFTKTICKNQTYVFNNQNLSQAGIYRDTLTNALGCDSFITLNLSTNGLVYDTIKITRCDGLLYNNYPNSGVYQETYTSYLGCDSFLTIHLTYLPPTEYRSQTYDKCGAFRYKGKEYTQNDTLIEIIKNQLNCDSIQTTIYINITKPSPITKEEQTIPFCEMMDYKGQMKTQSFHTKDTIKSLEYPYCDSVYQLYFYRREDKPHIQFSRISDTVVKGTVVVIEAQGAAYYRWSTGETNSMIEPKIEETTTYYVSAWNIGDCEATASIHIAAIEPLSIDFPTAFSPNGDMKNDYFYPNTNQPIQILNFQIFNRWGEKVYEYTPLSRGWDGNYIEQPAPQGIYSYILEYRFLGNQFKKSGRLIVVR